MNKLFAIVAGAVVFLSAVAPVSAASYRVRYNGQQVGAGTGSVVLFSRTFQTATSRTTISIVASGNATVSVSVSTN